jgi:hypothetical protein
VRGVREKSAAVVRDFRQQWQVHGRIIRNLVGQRGSPIGMNLGRIGQSSESSGLAEKVKTEMQALKGDQSGIGIAVPTGQKASGGTGLD